MMLCDAFQSLTSACTSAAESPPSLKAPTAASSRELALFRPSNANGNSRSSLTGYAQLDAFTHSVEKITTLRVPRLAANERVGSMFSSMDAVLGLQLVASNRRDFRVCVNFVLPGSEAEALEIQPEALVVALNGRSMRGVSLQRVMGAIRRALVNKKEERGTVYAEVPELGDYIEIDLAQREHEVAVDRNPHALTQFPSPQGQHLPGVKQFEDLCEENPQEPKPSQEQPQTIAHGRERSRSFKHFWMSDRSCKACYDCEQLFTFFWRRHHCRSCGQIFCGNCCERLPQSFGDGKVDGSIERLRKQLVCHTCHRQLREGLQMELTGAKFETAGLQNKVASPTAQTLLLMPQHIAEAMERSTSDTSQYKPLDKQELFDKDEFSEDVLTSEQPEKSRPPALFSMFPKVQIVASMQHLTHQPRLHELGKEPKHSGRGSQRRARTLSEPLISLGRKDGQHVARKLKHSNSQADLGNPSNHRWSEAEFKRLVAKSNAEARIAGTIPRASNSRPKALSGVFDTAGFGSAIQCDPFGPDNLASKDVGLLAMVGLSNDVHDESEDAERVARRDAALHQMEIDARNRIEERIFHLLDNSPAVSQLFMVEQHRWMQIINLFAHRAAHTVSCEPDQGDVLDIMQYVRVQCLDGGRVQDSFFIDGVLVHKSLARKGMRSDILNPRILLIASNLDYQRKKEAISSLESVAGQEVEYMHIVTEKILTLHPDIVIFEGHVHRVAEELLFKANVAVVKNCRLLDLQRIARCTGASVLTSYDHIDKMSDVGVIGTCKRFYVMLSDQEPKSAKKIAFKANSDGVFVATEVNGIARQRKKRTQRQNIVFEGGITQKGCTLCLRGGSTDVFNEITNVLTAIIRATYNMRLQRAVLAAYGYIAPSQDHERSVAEEWFAKSSTSLYISLKSNSLSMRAALKETQAMCKWCKAHTRFNNISSLRVVHGVNDDDSSSSATVVQSGHPNWCTCGAKSSNLLRDRILFSTCWSTLEGKTASKADMMCIDFYSSNDMSLGQFLDKFCFANSKNEFKRAFSTSKLSFSHDTGRVIVRVKDLNEFKDTDDQLTSEGLTNECSYRSVVQKIRSDKVLMWSRNMGAFQTLDMLSSEYSVVPRDVWNYSFGKFLEDMFYGKAMGIDCFRFPHLAGVSGSRDASLAHYFSRRGRIVSVHVEPLEPVLHVALQPALWKDHVDHQVQLDAIHDLCDLVREVNDVTTSKVAESLADPFTPLQALQNLKIMRNEVMQWYVCFAAKLESNPPQDVFAYNAHFREIYEHAVEWSIRITRAVQTTVKPTMAVPINSPRSALPPSWFDPPQTESSDHSSEPPTPSVLESPTPAELTFQEPGNLAHLASFARSLAVSSPPKGMAQVANEVTNTLRMHGGSQHSEPWDADEGQDRYDESSHSIPADFMVDSDLPPNGGLVLGRAASAMGVFGQIASTMGALASKKALENFRLTQQAKKPDILGYLALPKRLLEWHPSLPLGANKDTVLVNARQPTSVVAYSLFSKEYSQCISDNMRKEATRHALEDKSTENGTQVPVDNCTRSDATTTMLRILRSATRNNVDHSFVDDNQFQPAMRFSCKSYYAMQFHALRKLYYGGDRNYVESLCNCQQWNAAGGKSGAGFLKTRDERFIAKAIPEIELQMFLSMANEYFCYMAKTFENDLSSMLSKVLGIYKVSISNMAHGGDNDSNVRMCVIVMENLMYGREVDFTFDLKGKMEGRYKEDINGANSTVLWDRNFVELAGGIPLPLQESALSLLLSAIMNDTSFLSTVQATDYSMLVGYDVKKQELVACIIDYIHKYDFMKMMEHAGKRLIQEEGEITVLNPKHYRRRFCLAMSKYFVTIPSRYTKVTTMVRSTASNVTTGSAQDDEREYNSLPPMSTSTTASTATVGSVSTIPGSLVSTQRR